MSATPSNTTSPTMATISDDREGRSSRRPRRTFELGSPEQSQPPTPTEDTSQSPPALQIPSTMADNGATTPSRTRSILNLTSSTLFGIYQPTGYNADREEPSTPWGTGAETPLDSGRSFSLDFARANIPDTFIKQERKEDGGRKKKLRRRSALPASQLKARRRSRRGLTTGYLLPLVGKNLALFTVGVLYGLLITHLHDRRNIAPVKVDLDRSNWTYLSIWGVAGTVLGQALPWIDALWASDDDEDFEEDYKENERSRRKSAKLTGLEGWMDVIRSIGVFVGIAFAIRKLPWQSTLQLSLTLALANPAIWYLIDRSPPGFVLSAIFATTGTCLLLVTNPALMTSPSTFSSFVKSPSGKTGGFNNGSANTAPVGDELVLGVMSQESVGVVTWIASVLFVSSVCFGNIGRRLATQ